jgi:tetratricopeptide (TPR) repeat protein
MKPSSRITVIASALFLIFLAGVVVALNLVDQERQHATLKEVLYISSPKVVKRLSLGYTGLMADIYWTRAVQYFGGHHHAGAEEYKLLPGLLDITTDLDPKLLVAYRFGANFLSPAPPNGAGQPEQAVALMEKGIRENPREWTLYYDLGFIYYFEFHDYAKAAKAFQQSAQLPNAHPFVQVVAATMAQHAGESQMARMLWATTLETSKDKQIRQNAIAHLRALVVDEVVPELERRVQEYRRRTGHLPASFEELVRAGLLRGIPLDPTGRSYRLKVDGTVEVRNPDELPFITQGIPENYTPPVLPNFKNINPDAPVGTSPQPIG